MRARGAGPGEAGKAHGKAGSVTWRHFNLNGRRPGRHSVGTASGSLSKWRPGRAPSRPRLLYNSAQLGTGTRLLGFGSGSRTGIWAPIQTSSDHANANGTTGIYDGLSRLNRFKVSELTGKMTLRLVKPYLTTILVLGQTLCFSPCQWSVDATIENSCATSELGSKSLQSCAATRLHSRAHWS